MRNSGGPNQLLRLCKLFSRKDRLMFGALIIMMIIAAFLEVLGIGMIPAFVSILSDPQRILQNETFGPLIRSSGITQEDQMLIYGVVFLILVFIVKNVYMLFYRFQESKFLLNKRYALSSRLMAAYMKAPYTFFLKRNSAELIRNTNLEINLVVNQVLLPIMTIAKESILVLSIMVFLFVMEPLISLFVVLVIGVLSSLFLIMTHRKMRRYGKIAQQLRRSMIQAAHEGFNSIKEARVLNRELYLIDLFRRMSLRYSNVSRVRRFTAQIPRPVIETVSVIGLMTIALVMSARGRSVSDIIPIIALFAVALVRLMPSVQQITHTLTSLQYQIYAVDPIYNDILGLRESGIELRRDRRKNSILEFTNLMTINNLVYKYCDNDDAALNGISLDVPCGSKIGLVGPSGSGKTTLVDIILGLLKPDNGSIKVDGRDICDCLSSWQRNIGYVPQHIALIDNTIRRNIAFATPDDAIDEGRVQRAVDLAQLAELVDTLPNGLDTIIGERGTRLSGGQRQRIGIARALYNEPQVLVMDEATSSLDNAVENKIVRAIESLKGTRTIIMIAHRLSTVVNCDQLYFLEKGRITGHGTYLELIRENAAFRRMVEDDGT